MSTEAQRKQWRGQRRKRKSMEKRKGAAGPSVREAIVFLRHAERAFAPLKAKRDMKGAFALLTLALLSLEGKMP